MPSTIYLSLGTNLGDRPANLAKAIDALPPKVTVTAQSPVYETAPWGYEDQPSFLNQVVQAQTTLPPRDLLSYIKRIERSLGREATFRYGPRVIDLDILFYEDLVFDLGSLSVPHPRLHERAFVLVPLASIAPDLVHPVLNQTIQGLLASVDTSTVTPYPAPET